MSIIIKTENEIEKMRVAGKLASEVLEMIESHVVPGITTDELNTICHDYIVNIQGTIPAPLNYRGFPKSICTSINHTVCHGIPSDKKLKSGDIINVDITVIKDGYHGDTSKMFCVGEVSPHAKRLIKITQEAMYLASNKSNMAQPWGTLAKPYNIMPKATVTRWSGNFADTVSAKTSMKIHTFCIMAKRAKAKCLKQA
jgi:methionyl aminopeptidase